jgi:hypothetical protein
MKKAQESAQTALTKQTELLNRSFDAEKTRISDAYTISVETLNKGLADLNTNVSDFKSIVDNIETVIKSIQGAPNFAQQQYAQAKQSLTDALVRAQAGGFANLKDIVGNLGSLGGDTSSHFATAVDYKREQQLNINALTDLKGLVGTQLTDSEKLVANSNDQLNLLKKNNDEQIKRLDDLRDSTLGVDKSVVDVNAAISGYGAAKQAFDAAKLVVDNEQFTAQYNALTDINTSVLSVKEAIEKYLAAKAALSSAGGGGGGGGAALLPDYTKAVIPPVTNPYLPQWDAAKVMPTPHIADYIDFTAEMVNSLLQINDESIKTFQGVLERTINSGANPAQIASIWGIPDDQIAAALHDARIPGFAVGTNYVPDDMLANIHQGERIIPAADNAELLMRLSEPVYRGNDNNNDNAELVAELKMLRESNEKMLQELKELKFLQEKSEKSNKKTAETLEQVTIGSLSIMTTAV